MQSPDADAKPGIGPCKAWPWPYAKLKRVTRVRCEPLDCPTRGRGTLTSCTRDTTRDGTCLHICAGTELCAWSTPRRAAKRDGHCGPFRRFKVLPAVVQNFFDPFHQAHTPACHVPRCMLHVACHAPGCMLFDPFPPRHARSPAAAGHAATAAPTWIGMSDKRGRERRRGGARCRRRECPAGVTPAGTGA